MLECLRQAVAGADRARKQADRLRQLRLEPRKLALVTAADPPHRKECADESRWQREQDLAQKEQARYQRDQTQEAHGREKLAGRHGALGLREDALEESERRGSRCAWMGGGLAARSSEHEMRIACRDRRLDEALEPPRDAALGVDQRKP